MTTYLLLKTLHIISFTAWFAGLFYLPRLFVYHVENRKSGAKTLDLFAKMERKLAVYIMRPAALATLLAGVGMAINEPYLFQQGWLHAKLGLVLLLIAFHISTEYYRSLLAAGKPTPSARFFRFYNEVPSLLLVAIVTLAVFKPF